MSERPHTSTRELCVVQTSPGGTVLRGSVGVDVVALESLGDNVEMYWKSFFSSKWMSKWFLLEGQALRFFKDEATAKPQGVISIVSGSTIQSDVDATDPAATRDDCSLEFEVRRRCDAAWSQGCTPAATSPPRPTAAVPAGCRVCPHSLATAAVSLQQIRNAADGKHYRLRARDRAMLLKWVSALRHSVALARMAGGASP